MIVCSTACTGTFAVHLHDNKRMNYVYPDSINVIDDDFVHLSCGTSTQCSIFIQCSIFMSPMFLVRKYVKPIGMGITVGCWMRISLSRTNKALIPGHLVTRSKRIALRSSRFQIRSIAAFSLVSPIVDALL